MGWIDLYDAEGGLINLDAFGLLGLRLDVPSPSYDTETETIEGMDGEIVIARKLNPRELTAVFWSKSSDYQESLKNRNKIYAYLGSGQEYYVGESNVAGLRWLVRVGEWNPQRINSKIQEIEIPLISKSGKSESNNVVERIFNTPSFRYKNEGDTRIDMRAQTETEIVFKGASNNLEITNITTGDVWKYNGSATANDVIVLKGVRSTKNDNSIFGQTNMRLISFAPGWNDLEVKGETGPFELTIRTRFYFL